MVVAMGIAFFFVATVMALYFGYQQIESERAEPAAHKQRADRLLAASHFDFSRPPSIAIGSMNRARP
jgi:hypothetical protein